MTSENKILGDWGEQLAIRFLSERGYRILEKNQRFSFKELDIVAYDGAVLVFVEVKTRTSSRLGSAIDMIGKNKLRNMKYAAMGYLQRVRPKYGNLRFDAIAIDVDRLTKTVKIKHYKDII
jgi:putative endonuclease